MVSPKINDAIEYVKTLIGIPYRWYEEGEDAFSGSDKFWAINLPAPSATEIIQNTKNIFLGNYAYKVIEIPRKANKKC